MLAIRRAFARLLMRGVRFLGVEDGQKIVQGYIPQRSTVRAAKERGQSVCDYLETIWNKQGDTQRVVDTMKELGVLTGVRHVVEIGTGSGRYLENAHVQQGETQATWWNLTK